VSLPPADPPTGPEDYAHTRDPQAQRTRYELWAIVAIVVVVLAVALGWRLATGRPAAPMKGWNASDNVSGASVITPAGGAGVNRTATPSTSSPPAR
jgi:hypothetical protein